MPAAVVAASRKLHEAEQKRTAAREAVAGAEADVVAARREDEAAATKAVQAGRKTPAAKLLVAQEQAAERRRDLEAHTNIVGVLRRELVAAVLADHPEIADACERETEAVGKEASKLIAKLETLLARRREVEVLAQAVEPGALEGRDAGFSPAAGGRRRRDPLVGGPRELVESLRDHFAPRRLKREVELSADERAQVEDARAQGRRPPEFERPEWIAWKGAGAA